MGFNVGALTFVKMKKEANKDEMFMVGYLVGIENAFEMMASSNGVENEDVREVVKDIMPNEKVRALWNQMERNLELDLRSPEEVGVIVPDKED